MRKRIKFLVPFLASFMALFFLSLPVSADTLNQRVNFNVNDEFDKYKRTSLDATLRHIDERAYYYVDDRYWNRLDIARQNTLMGNITSLAEAFRDIYDKETLFWGQEPKPGVDGDSRITILFEELIDSNGGYFDSGNGYEKEKVGSSNEREMISVNIEVVSAEVSLSKVFLAHEFQHLISFNHKENKYSITEDVWLNEMRSEYSVSKAGLNIPYAGSNLSRRVNVFTNNQVDSLTEWPNKNPDYAVVNIFGEYLVEQFGEEILSETLKNSLTGISSINKYLADKRHPERFSDIYLNWMGAVYLNDADKNPKLGYKKQELRTLRVAPQQKVYLSPSLDQYSTSRLVKDWQPLWLEFDVSAFSADPGKSLNIKLSGATGHNFVSSYLAFYDSGKVDYGKINVVSGQGSGYAMNSADRLSRVVVLATKSTKSGGFGANETAEILNVTASVVDTGQARANALQDGALIKRPREKEIYVVWGKYKRYLNPEVIKLYGHLDPASAIELESSVFDSYQTSNYVKYVNDEKVYAVWPDGTKHWLRITPGQWDASNRDWNAIFTINELEVNHYKTGTDITR